MTREEYLLQLRLKQKGIVGDNEIGQVAYLNSNPNPKEEYDDLNVDKGNWFERTFSTLEEAQGKITDGIFDTVEGIGDAFIGLFGTIGSWFGADDQWAKDAVEYDWSKDVTNFLLKTQDTLNPFNWDNVGEMWSDEDYLNTISEKSWTSENETVQNITDNIYSLVGHMLPSIATGQVLGMAGFGTTAMKAGSLGVMATGAVGSGTDEALKDGAENLGSAYLYGLLSGSVETLTELIPFPGGNAVGGLIGKETGKGVISTITKQFLEEGTEEVISTLANPLIKMSYKGTEATKEYLEPEFLKEVVSSFVYGGIGSLIFGGADEIIVRKQTGKVGYEYLGTSREIANIKEDLDKLNAKYENNPTERLSKKINKLNQDLNIETEKLIKISEQLGKDEKSKKKITEYLVGAQEDFKTMQDINNAFDNLNSSNLEQYDYQMRKVNEFARKLGKKYGITPTIEFRDNLGVNASYQNGKILIDSKFKNNSSSFLAHESWHFVSDLMSEEAKNKVYQEMQKQGIAKEYENRIKNTKSYQEDTNQDIHLRDETIAYYLENSTQNFKDLNKTYINNLLMRNLFKTQNKRVSRAIKSSLREVAKNSKKIHIADETLRKNIQRFSESEEKVSELKNNFENVVDELNSGSMNNAKMRKLETYDFFEEIVDNFNKEMRKVSEDLEIGVESSYGNLIEKFKERIEDFVKTYKSSLAKEMANDLLEQVGEKPKYKVNKPNQTTLNGKSETPQLLDASQEVETKKTEKEPVKQENKKVVKEPVEKKKETKKSSPIEVEVVENNEITEEPNNTTENDIVVFDNAQEVAFVNELTEKLTSHLATKVYNTDKINSLALKKSNLVLKPEVLEVFFENSNKEDEKYIGLEHAAIENYENQEIIGQEDTEIKGNIEKKEINKIITSSEFGDPTWRFIDNRLFDISLMSPLERQVYDLRSDLIDTVNKLVSSKEFYEKPKKNKSLLIKEVVKKINKMLDISKNEPSMIIEYMINDIIEQFRIDDFHYKPRLGKVKKDTVIKVVNVEPISFETETDVQKAIIEFVNYRLSLKETTTSGAMAKKQIRRVIEDIRSLYLSQDEEFSLKVINELKNRLDFTNKSTIEKEKVEDIEELDLTGEETNSTGNKKIELPTFRQNETVETLKKIAEETESKRDMQLEKGQALKSILSEEELSFISDEGEGTLYDILSKYEESALTKIAKLNEIIENNLNNLSLNSLYRVRHQISLLAAELHSVSNYANEILYNYRIIRTDGNKVVDKRQAIQDLVSKATKKNNKDKSIIQNMFNIVSEAIANKNEKMNKEGAIFLNKIETEEKDRTIDNLLKTLNKISTTPDFFGTIDNEEYIEYLKEFGNLNGDIPTLAGFVDAPNLKNADHKSYVLDNGMFSAYEKHSQKNGKNFNTLSIDTFLYPDNKVNDFARDLKKFVYDRMYNGDTTRFSIRLIVNKDIKKKTSLAYNLLQNGFILATTTEPTFTKKDTLITMTFDLFGRAQQKISKEEYINLSGILDETSINLDEQNAEVLATFSSSKESKETKKEKFFKKREIQIDLNKHRPMIVDDPRFSNYDEVKKKWSELNSKTLNLSQETFEKSIDDIKTAKDAEKLLKRKRTEASKQTELEKYFSQKIETFTTQFASIKNMSEAELEKYTNGIKELKNEIDTKTKEKAGLNDEIDFLLDIIDELDETISAKLDEKLKANKENTYLNKKLKNKKAKIDARQEEIKTLNKIIDGLYKDKSNKETSIENLQFKVNSLVERIVELDNKIVDKNREFDTARKRVERENVKSEKAIEKSINALITEKERKTFSHALIRNRSKVNSFANQQYMLSTDTYIANGVLKQKRIAVKGTINSDILAYIGFYNNFFNSEDLKKLEPKHFRDFVKDTEYIVNSVNSLYKSAIADIDNEFNNEVDNTSNYNAITDLLDSDPSIINQFTNLEKTVEELAKTRRFKDLDKLSKEKISQKITFFSTNKNYLTEHTNANVDKIVAESKQDIVKPKSIIDESVKRADKKVLDDNVVREKVQEKLLEVIKNSKKKEVAKNVAEWMNKNDWWIKWQLNVTNNAVVFENALKDYGFTEQEAEAMSGEIRRASNKANFLIQNNINGKKSLVDAMAYLDEGIENLNSKKKQEIRTKRMHEGSLYLFNLYQIDNNEMIKFQLEDKINNFKNSDIYKFLIGHNAINLKNLENLVKQKEQLFEEKISNVADKIIDEVKINIDNIQDITLEEKAKYTKLFVDTFVKITQGYEMKTVFGKIIEKGIFEGFNFKEIEKVLPNFKELVLKKNDTNFIWFETVSQIYNSFVQNYANNGIPEGIKGVKIEYGENNKPKLVVEDDKFNKAWKELNSYAREFTNNELEATNKAILKGTPEILKFAKAIREYLDEMQKIRVSSGILTQKELDYMKKIYPHYVPTYREQINYDGSYRIVKGANVSNDVRSRKGSADLISPLVSSIYNQTFSTMKKAAINRIANLIDNKATETHTRDIETDITLDPERKVVEHIYSADELLNAIEEQTKALVENNTITYRFFDKETGELQYRKMKLTNYAMQPFSEILDEHKFDDIPLLSGMRKASALFRNLITSYNPFFVIRNAVRDFGDAVLTTEHNFSVFMKEMVNSYQQIIKKDPLYMEFLANGGSMGLNLDMGRTNLDTLQKATNKRTSKYAKYSFKDNLERINHLVEIAPRFTEFKLSYNKYINSENADVKANAMSLALLDSAKITTDFSRGGTVAKSLNRTIIPFLNAQIQGFSKVYKFAKKSIWNLIHPSDREKFLSTIARLLILGLAPEIISWLINLGNEDYEALPEYTKANYMLIPAGKGQFIKIPKSRILGTVQNFFYQTLQMVKGEKGIVDAGKDFYEVASTNLLPVDLGSGIRFIWSPITDAINNKTWYGQAIDTQSDLNKYAYMRYDTTTSEIGKVIGRAFNVSPKRIDYLLESFTGVVGDIFLPLSVQDNYKNPNDAFSFITSNLTVSAVKNNKYRSETYELLENLTFEKNAGNKVAAMQYNYLNRTLNDIKTLEDTANTASGSAERYTAYLTLREAYHRAIQNTELIGEKLEGYNNIDTNDRFAMTEAYRQVFGSQYALEYYNDSVYTKALQMNQLGINFDDFYNAYFEVKAVNNKESQMRVIRKIRGNYFAKLYLAYLCGVSLNEQEKKQVNIFLKRYHLEI